MALDFHSKDRVSVMSNVPVKKILEVLLIKAAVCLGRIHFCFKMFIGNQCKYMILNSWALLVVSLKFSLYIVAASHF